MVDAFGRVQPRRTKEAFVVSGVGGLNDQPSNPPCLDLVLCKEEICLSSPLIPSRVLAAKSEE